MEGIIKIYFPLFFSAFIILVFIVPTIRVYKQTGINPFRFIRSQDKAHDFVGVAMKVFILILFLSIIIYSFFEQLYQYLAPFHYLETMGLKITGLILSHFSLGGIIIAQLHMRASWRIGIDYENKTPLVTKGFFKISRNPIYLFLVIGLIGLFLVLPNAITFAVLFAAYFIVHVIIRLEEEFLYEQHEEQYLLYKKKVRRFL